MFYDQQSRWERKTQRSQKLKQTLNAPCSVQNSEINKREQEKATIPLWEKSPVVWNSKIQEDIQIRFFKSIPSLEGGESSM